MHNGIGNPPIASGDVWFCEHLQCYSISNYIQWAQTHNSLFILTFDEDDGFFGNNIPTIFNGPMVKGGKYSDSWTLYNVLRTIEDMYGLNYAGNASTNVPILNCWKDEATGINAPAQSAAGLHIYPNPVASVINFDGSALNETGNPQISITDVTGRLLGKFPFPASKKLSINTADYSAGVYFYHLDEGNTQIETGKFL